jgi:hypothetical protein
MMTIIQRMDEGRLDPHTVPRGKGMPTILLVCGILSSLLYLGMLVFVPLAWEGYSSASRTVSELSAIDAPSRPVWVPLGLVWSLLYAAFGWGIWVVAGPDRQLRVAGSFLSVAAILGLFWPPMHQREILAAGGATLTDTLHIAWTAANGILVLLAMGFSAAAFGRRFALYSVATMVILLGAGLMTTLDAPRLEANLPTPWMGIWERVNIGAWLLWVAVLAIALLRRHGATKMGTVST